MHSFIKYRLNFWKLRFNWSYWLSVTHRVSIKPIFVTKLMLYKYKLTPNLATVYFKKHCHAIFKQAELKLNLRKPVSTYKHRQIDLSTTPCSHSCQKKITHKKWNHFQTYLPSPQGEFRTSTSPLSLRKYRLFVAAWISLSFNILLVSSFFDPLYLRSQKRQNKIQ